MMNPFQVQQKLEISNTSLISKHDFLEENFDTQLKLNKEVQKDSNYETVINLLQSHVSELEF